MTINLTGCLVIASLGFGLALPAAANPVLERARQVQAVADAWAAFGAGEFDALAAFYAEDTLFVMPGQTDVIEGRSAFRAALDGIGEAVPPGFKIDAVRYLTGPDEVVNIIDWSADKLPEGSTLAITFRFDDEGLISEERWFVDTVQWQAAF
ncbi:MAG: nuclear transport factor 2 family protein [Paracoccaceae bacterium]